MYRSLRLRYIFLRSWGGISAGGGFDRVGSSGTVKSHSNTAIVAPKSGYVFIYCSNESPHNVFFDNIQVIHSRGPLLEETHYYPFGLTMAGISSKATDRLENKRKWNASTELNTDFDINFYETFYRSLDPQLGRFWQIDPKVESGQLSFSPYLSMANNPILLNDPLGDIVKINGFTEEDILKFFSTGLKLNKDTKKLFSFSKGALRYDKSIYKRLSSDQKKIANAIVKEINSTKTFIISKANNETVTEKGKITKSYDKILDYTSEIQQPDQKMGDHAAKTTRSDDGNTVTHFINAEYFEKVSKNDSPVNSEGKAIRENPLWLVVFHEIGHGYLRDILNSPEQRGHTVNYENLIRALNNLEIRGFDEAHPKPRSEYPKEE